MAAAASARAAPLHPGLPDEIFIWEILVRLPPKALLRCRAVCPAWRRATSGRDFLLAHHGRQPSLPILCQRGSTDDDGRCRHLDILSLDHRTGVAADQLRPVARLDIGGVVPHIKASCDGLLVLSTGEGYSVCNPATRQHAPLPPLLRGFYVAGMYLHPPTGEYRLLLLRFFSSYGNDYDEPEAGVEYDCYVYTLGSCEPWRKIGWPEAGEAIHEFHSLHFHDSLHWFVEKDGDESCKIMVFDATAELFRQMRAPAAVPFVAKLFEMDAMLAMASIDCEEKNIDIWIVQDYDREVWAFKCRVELPERAIMFNISFRGGYSKLMVSSWDDPGGVLILFQYEERLLQIDIDGKLVTSSRRELLGTTDFHLKQSLVPHTFFPTIEGYVVNTWPFISPDN